MVQAGEWPLQITIGPQIYILTTDLEDPLCGLSVNKQYNNTSMTR